MRVLVGGVRHVGATHDEGGGRDGAPRRARGGGAGDGGVGAERRGHGSHGTIPTVALSTRFPSIAAIPFLRRDPGTSVPAVGEAARTDGDGSTGRSGRENGATRLLPEPVDGRVFRTTRRVRLAEADPSARLRLDAAARILQDVATDDSHDLGSLRARAWVVRRTVIEQVAAARYNEELSLSTFCSGLGSRWAERRISMRGSRGGRIETVTLWVHVDPGTGRPMRLTDDFVAVYAASTAGREVTARQEHEPVLPEDDDVHTMPWWPRVTDLDVLDHVNNAASWEVVEQAIDRAVERGLSDLDRSGRLRAEVEFREAVDADVVRSAMPLTVAWCVRHGVLGVTLWSTDGATAHVTARVMAFEPDDWMTEGER